MQKYVVIGTGGHAKSIYRNIGPLAQSVEQQTFNLWVVGSIPTGPTKFLTQLTPNLIGGFVEYQTSCS